MRGFVPDCRHGDDVLPSIVKILLEGIMGRLSAWKIFIGGRFTAGCNYTGSTQSYELSVNTYCHRWFMPGELDIYRWNRSSHKLTNLTSSTQLAQSTFQQM